jgi:hypothetical protein
MRWTSTTGALIWNVASFTASLFPGTYSVTITNPTTGCTGSGSELYHRELHGN